MVRTLKAGFAKTPAERAEARAPNGMYTNLPPNNNQGNNVVTARKTSKPASKAGKRLHDHDHEQLAELLSKKLDEGGISRESLLHAAEVLLSASEETQEPTATAPAKTKAKPAAKVSSTVPLNWKEVWFTTLS